MVVNGKNKGNEFERQIAKKMSLWISCGETNDIFWRTQNSGGRFTTRLKSGNDVNNTQAGDITSTSLTTNDFINFFTIECKAYKNLDFFGVLKETGNIVSFWKKLSNECDDIGKKPILICKQNHMPILWCMNGIGKSIFDALYRLKYKCCFPDLDIYLYLFNDVMSLDPIVLLNFISMQYNNKIG